MGYLYRDLIAWQKARKLVADVYLATESLPQAERFGLTSQIRRSAVSVPSNIAEGQGRLTRGEFQQFLGNARGSLLELQTQLQLANDLGFLSLEVFERLNAQAEEVLRVLNGLIDSLKRKAAAAGAGRAES